MNVITLEKQQIHTGTLILVNADYGCTDSSAPLLAVCDGTPACLMQRQAVMLLSSLMDEIHGWEGIVPVSGWRSQKEQQALWDSSLAENGAEFTKRYVALPGHSEHQTGLAIDLGAKQEVIDFIRPDFPYSGICQTFRENAPAYGFIERYPAEKAHITGISHEPWHFRYVGAPHAGIMKRYGLVLEEYISFIRHFPYNQNPYHVRSGQQDIAVSYLKAEPNGATRLTIDAGTPYSVSGNNIDGFIITQWRNRKA